MDLAPVPSDVLEPLAGDDPAAVDAGGPWTISDLGAADWAMARLAELEAEAAAVVEHANRVRRAADEYEERCLSAPRRGPNGEQWSSVRDGIIRFRSLLEAYALEQRAAGNGTTLSLVSGSVTTRKNPERVVITSEAALIDWAQGYGLDVVETTKRVLVSELRRIVKPVPDGDPDGDRYAVIAADQDTPMLLPEIPGVAIEPATVTATAKPDGLA
jgi:Bacteriophage Mu Gam like protein